MESVTNANFGPLIAYLVPGATVLAGFSQFSPVLRSWFGAAAGRRPDDRRLPVSDRGVDCRRA